MQVEIEFTWPLSRRNAGHMPAIAPRANVTKLAARANGAGRQGHTGRAKRK